MYMDYRGPSEYGRAFWLLALFSVTLQTLIVNQNKIEAASNLSVMIDCFVG